MLNERLNYLSNKFETVTPKSVFYRNKGDVNNKESFKIKKQ